MIENVGNVLMVAAKVNRYEVPVSIVSVKR